MFQTNLVSLVYGRTIQIQPCSSWIWNIIGFGASNVPNLTMSQVRFGISQVGFGTWIIQNRNSDLGCTKSKFRFGISQVGFGTWSRLDYNRNMKRYISRSQTILEVY